MGAGSGNMVPPHEQGRRVPEGSWIGALVLVSAILWTVGIVYTVKACRSTSSPPAVTTTCQHGESSVSPGRTTPRITGCAP